MVEPIAPAPQQRPQNMAPSRKKKMKKLKKIKKEKDALKNYAELLILFDNL